MIEQTAAKPLPREAKPEFLDRSGRGKSVRAYMNTVRKVLFDIGVVRCSNCQGCDFLNWDSGTDLASFALRRIAPDGLPDRRPPRLRLLEALGVAIERAFEISQPDDEAGLAIAKADLEDIVLDEGPDRVAERGPQRHPLAGEHARADGGVAVGLVQDLLEIAERILPDRVLERADTAVGAHLDALVDDAGVAHRAFAIELRLAEIRIPAGALDPAPHEVVAARNVVGVVRRAGGQKSKDLVAHLRRATLVGVEAENPFARAGVGRAVAQLAERGERNLH